ncbi:MAG: lipoprotein insertase outer membrane protein LolB [Gammaproteobacteria bacterium]|nr:MAG: lipoprotein insertase outer membrane protein LolB [Gammaproteobacteria bacterium]
MRRPAVAMACALAVVALLDACTLRREEPAPAVDWDARRTRLLSLDAWLARGRIAVKADAGSGQGDLRWEQHGASARIRVSGPFGAGAYDIRWDPARLSVSSRNGEFSRDYTGPDAAGQFLAEQLGWAFPAGSVRYWLLGLSDPQFPAGETRASGGQPELIEQNGWTIRFEAFEDQSGTPMPRRLTLASDAARVRLIVDHWCLEAHCLAR